MHCTTHVRRVSVLAAGLLAAWSAPASAQDAVAVVPGRVLVKFRDGVPAEQVRSLVASAGARTLGILPRIGVHVLQLPGKGAEMAAARAFARHSEVAFAEPDYVFGPQDVTPNDPWYANSQWALKKIQCPTAWSTTTGSSGVTIAILDTGVNGAHSDLSAKLVAGWNFFDNNSNTADVYGHGTLVAGTAAAASNNALGVASVAWNCKIMPIRVTDSAGYGYVSMMASGLTWAADRGARVANISFNVTGSASLSAAAVYFRAKGGVITVSSGNSGSVSSTPDDPNLLTISATDAYDKITSYSTTGPCVDLAAPGSAATTTSGGGFTISSGTSISAPIVAGVVALVISANPNLTAAEIDAVLRQSADDCGTAGYDTVFGWGRVNAARAVALAVAAGGTDIQAPTVSISSPTAGGTVSGTVSVRATAADNVGVSSVAFYLDGVLKWTDTAAPYAWSWDSTTTASGGHTLKAVAVDGAGNSGTAQITVTVSNTTADTAPPAVSLTTPADGGTVSGVVSVAADASDNVGVAAVEFYLDGVLKSTDTAAPYSWSWDTTGAANGIHTLKATARDAAGNSASTQMTVNVSNPAADTTAPAIEITSPANGASVGANVTVTVNATDNVGVTRVELYVDGVLTQASSSAPFTMKWNARKAPAGAHTLQCKAYDGAGNVGVSAVVTVYR